MAAHPEALASPIFHLSRCALSPTSPSENPIDTLLAANPRVRHITDVYRALAMLLQRGSDDRNFAHAACAVIACLDDWSEEEFEFFRLLRAARPEITTLVYSTLSDERRVDRALRAAAAGRATVTEINLLLTIESPAKPAPIPTRLPPTAPPKAQPPNQPRPMHLTPAPVATPMAPESTHLDDDELPPLDADEESVTDEDAPDEELVGEDDTQESLSTDDGQTPTRVPWLRYNDQPLRTGPGARIPPTAGPRTPPENGTPAVERQGAKPVPPSPLPRPLGPPPLLSEEELRALLEDDVSALAPRDETPRQREPRSSGL